MRQPAHRRIVEVPVIPGETDGVDPRKQLRENPADLQTGQSCAKAVVDATAKGKMVGRVAVQVEGVWVVEVARIPVRRTEQEQNACAGRNRVRTDGVVPGSGSVEPLNR